MKIPAHTHPTPRRSDARTTERARAPRLLPAASEASRVEGQHTETTPPDAHTPDPPHARQLELCLLSEQDSTSDAPTGPATDPSGASGALMEPSLFYDPPYDNSLDDTFAWHLVKYLAPTSGLRYKVSAPAAGRLRPGIDFLVEQGTRRIAFMIDTPGAEADDRLHDGLLMGLGAVDVLYRFRAEDLSHRLHDVLYLASRWDPDLFSERGRINLNTLASPEARACQPGAADTSVQLRYTQADPAHSHAFDLQAPDAPRSTRCVVRRLSQQHATGWKAAYERAVEQVDAARAGATRRWAQSA